MYQYKVLVADDEISNLNGVVSLLARECPEITVVATYADGRSVIEYLKNHEVDVAIIDIRMPLVDGLEVAEYIYKNAIDTSVIIMTGYKEFDYAKRAINLHVSAFLEKPFDLKESVDKIKEVCGARAREQEGITKVEINYVRNARLLLDRLLSRKHEEIELLNEIINCYSRSQLSDFVVILLQEMSKIADMSWEEYEEQVEKANTKETMMSLVRQIENDYVDKLTSENNDYNMKKIENYIEEHCGEELTLRQVAEAFFYNYSYLSRIFKEKKGETFSEFLLQTRMEKAKQLLKEGNKSANEIAGMVGYNEYASFKKTFKAHVGLSPSRYAELQRIRTDEKKK